MKRYKFALEAALRARRAQEEVARQALAVANHEVRLARHVYEEARRECLVEVEDGRISVIELRSTLDAERRKAERAQRAHMLVAEAEVSAATRYAAWVETAKAVASLERLEDRRRGEWSQEELREEAGVIDDIATARWMARAAHADSRVGR